MEIFKVDGTKEMHGIFYLSDTKCKNYDTVMFLEEQCISYVQSLRHNIIRYDRLTDGCSSQFWCYGSMYHLESMPKKYNISLVNQHRYEAYEGKNFSDALGSLLKRRMRTCALQNKVFKDDDVSNASLLDDIEDDIDLEDLVFESHTQAFEWLQMIMSKSNSDTFWTPGLPEGVLSNRPCPWSVRPSLNISETAHWFFLIFCMKLGHHKGTKVTEPDF